MVAENCTTHPFDKAQNLMTHPVSVPAHPHLYFLTSPLSEAKIKHYIDIIKQKYIAYWQHTIHHCKKLQFYSLFKHDYKISSYLDLIRNSANRKDLVKIRISNHKLMIETGRYNQTSRNDRVCPICNSGIIEDEFHFLFHFPKYSISREKFCNQIQQNFVDFNQLS